MALTWMGYYESCIASDQSCINEWNTMKDLETTRPDSPSMFVDKSVNVSWIVFCTQTLTLILVRVFLNETQRLWCLWGFIFGRPSERERTECLIKAKLRSIMTCQDLENVTCKQVKCACCHTYALAHHCCIVSCLFIGWRQSYSTGFKAGFVRSASWNVVFCAIRST